MYLLWSAMEKIQKSKANPIFRFLACIPFIGIGWMATAGIITVVFMHLPVLAYPVKNIFEGIWISIVVFKLIPRKAPLFAIPFLAAFLFFHLGTLYFLFTVDHWVGFDTFDGVVSAIAILGATGTYAWFSYPTILANRSPKNDRESFTWYHQAALAGHAEAQFNLGLIYAGRRSGPGWPRDDTEAIHWFHRAAEQGHAGAQNELGERYADGYGAVKDDAEAANWWRKAAQQGHPDAQYSLGIMYQNGRGVAKDLVLAHKWISIAATTSEDARLVLDRLQKNMTPAEVAEAQRLAREWTVIRNS